MTKNKSKFKWSEPSEESFQLLEYKLTSTPILTLLEGIDGCVVYCDASPLGLGFVLMQHVKVKAYEYRQHNPQEKNYLTHDLELATLVFVLKIWRHYLYRVHVDVFTNQKCLQYMYTQKYLHLCQGI